MQVVAVAQFKSDFSSILASVQEGEEYIISYGKQHKKVARLIPYTQERPAQRVFGQLKGQIDIPDNFDEEDPQILDMFYGKAG